MLSYSALFADRALFTSSSLFLALFNIKLTYRSPSDIY